VEENRLPCWTATYRTEKGTEYSIEGVETAECPVSLISPRAAEIVQVFSRAKYAKDGAGAALYGPDLSKWPAWAVDAAVAIEQERIREHNARSAAEVREMGEE
jgi:hypothetical protein